MLFPFHCPKYDTRDFFAQEKTLLPGWLLDAKLAAREPPQEVAPLLPDRQVIYETELGYAAEEARRVLGQAGLSSSEDETQLSDPDATVDDVFVDGGRKRRAEQQPLAPGRGGGKGKGTGGGPTKAKGARGGATDKRGKGGRA